MKTSFIDLCLNTEKIKSMWFNNSCFFCVYKFHEGGIILADASPAYFRVINRNRNLCGHPIEDILDSCNVVFLKKLFFSLIGGKTVRYVRKCINDNTLWQITVLAGNGCINCIGQQLDFSEFASEELFFEHNTYKGSLFLSAAAALYPDGSFRLLSAGSEKYSGITDRIRSGMKLERIFKIFRFSITGETLLSECILNNKSVSYSDIIEWGENNVKAVNIRLTPIADKKNPMIVIAVDEICFPVSDYSENEFEKGYGSCCISRSGEGIIITERINSLLEELIGSCEISLEQLCADEYFSDRKSRTITGKSGGSYEVCVISEHRDDDRMYRTLLIIPVYCNSGCDLVTRRELQLLKLAAGGNPNRYIAKVLNISEGTVKKILHNGYAKLGIGSRVELVKYFSDNNIPI